MKALLILILLMPVIKVTQAQERTNNIAIDLNGKKLTLKKVSLAMYKSILSKPFNRRIKDTSIIKRVGVLRFKLPYGKEVTFKDINSKHEADNKTFLFKGMELQLFSVGILS